MAVVFVEASIDTLDPETLLTILDRMQPVDIINLCNVSGFDKFCRDPQVSRELIRHHYSGFSYTDTPWLQFRALAQGKITTYLFDLEGFFEENEEGEETACVKQDIITEISEDEVKNQINVVEIFGLPAKGKVWIGGYVTSDESVSGDIRAFITGEDAINGAYDIYFKSYSGSSTRIIDPLSKSDFSAALKRNECPLWYYIYDGEEYPTQIYFVRLVERHNIIN